MANILKTTIQVRRGKTEEWVVNKDVVPKAGEPCLDLDLHKVKYGDGVTTYEKLPFASGGDGVASTHYEGVREEGEDDQAVIARVLGELEATANKGDTFVIKTEFAGDKVSYIAFVYNGSAWAAMDGNYNAENVYLDSDLTITANIGVQQIDPSGSKVLPTTGKNIKQVLDLIMTEEKNPTVTQPSVSVSSSEAKSYEAGTRITPKYNATLNPGKYEFGPETGVTATSWSVTLDSQTLTEASGTFSEIQVTDSTNLKITATAQHSEGAVPKTNLGNEYADGKITADSKSRQTGAITGFRQMFYGVDTTGGEINSALIRGLTAGGAASAKTITVNAVAEAKCIIVAVPQSSALKVKQAILTSSMNADITSSYVKQPDPVNVEGANGFDAVPYDIYVYRPASIDASEVHKITIGK